MLLRVDLFDHNYYGNTGISGINLRNYLFNHSYINLEETQY